MDNFNFKTRSSSRCVCVCQLKQTNQRLVEKLKTSEQQLSALQEQHCHLVGLSRNQQLGERETLANQVRDLQHSLHDHNNTIQVGVALQVL